MVVDMARNFDIRYVRNYMDDYLYNSGLENADYRFDDMCDEFKRYMDDNEIYDMNYIDMEDFINIMQRYDVSELGE